MWMSGRGSGRKIKFYPFTNPRKCATLSYIVKSSDEESTVPERATEKSRGRRCADLRRSSTGSAAERDASAYCLI